MIWVDKQIYNANEAALYRKLLRTEDYQSSSMNFGYKKQKDRVTLLFEANKGGSDKLKLFLVDKNKSPRVLKKANQKNLPLIYEGSKNACITQTLFKKRFFDNFIPSFRLFLRDKGLEENAVILMNQCRVILVKKNLCHRIKILTLCFCHKTQQVKFIIFLVLKLF